MKQTFSLLIMCSALLLSGSAFAQRITRVRPFMMCDSVGVDIDISSYSTGLTVKTLFGDGTNTTSTVTAYSGVGYTYAYHQYRAPGTYTAKSILYAGTSPIDSMVYILTAPGSCGYTAVTAYNDANGNCIKDAGESEIRTGLRFEIDSAGIPIDTIQYSGYYMSTGTMGTVYTYRLLTPPLGFRATCPTSGVVYDTINYVSNSPTMGFTCDTAGFDLSIAGNTIASRNRSYGYFSIQNNRCTPQNATVTYSFSPKYRFDTLFCSASHTYTVVGNQVNINIGVINPNQIKYMSILLDSARTLIMGDTAHFSISVAPTTGDARPSNNAFSEIDTIRSSYDPNAKSVSPEGDIAAGTQLQYQIDFENTGNDTAFNIHVMDTLSDFLDISTLQPVTSSASVNYILTKWNGHNVLKLDFPNINLLDSSYHGLCYGFCIFKINVKGSTPIGTVVKNRVGIYFDYNEVVMTNEVNNRIPYPASVSEITSTSSVLIYPNPVHDILHIGDDAGEFTGFILTDMIGRTLIKGACNKNTVDVSGLTSGVYLISLQQEGKASVVKKFIKD